MAKYARPSQTAHAVEMDLGLFSSSPFSGKDMYFHPALRKRPHQVLSKSLCPTVRVVLVTDKSDLHF
jgi:hypothetical protein